MSYRLHVFQDGREQGGLLVNHPFYRLVEETLQNVLQSQLVMLYMARKTLEHKPSPDVVRENQRVTEITRYLQNVCPTISGSNSPTMDSIFVEMRAYAGCGEDPKRRKVARKHVYIQKHLIGTWIHAYYNAELSYNEPQGKFL